MRVKGSERVVAIERLDHEEEGEEGVIEGEGVIEAAVAASADDADTVKVDMEAVAEMAEEESSE
jgi:hypothetical protein